MVDDIPTRQTPGAEAVHPDRYVSAKSACEQLIFQSFRLIDDGQAAKVRALFVAEGVHTLNGDRCERDGLTAFFAAREANVERVTRHVVTNLLFTLVAEDRAEIRYTSAVYVLSSPQPIPGAITDMHDTFVMDDRSGRWMLSSRDIVIVAGAR